MKDTDIKSLTLSRFKICIFTSQQRIEKMDSQIKLYTDTSITINRLAQILESSDIPSLIRNNVNSAVMAGFGSTSNNVDLYIYVSDIEKAEQILTVFLEGND